MSGTGEFFVPCYIGMPQGGVGGEALGRVKLEQGLHLGGRVMLVLTVHMLVVLRMTTGH